MLGTQNTSPGTRLEWPWMTGSISAGISKNLSPRSMGDTCVLFISSLLIPSPCRLLKQSFSIFRAPMYHNGWVGRKGSLVGVLKICPPALHCFCKWDLTLTHKRIWGRGVSRMKGVDIKFRSQVGQVGPCSAGDGMEITYGNKLLRQTGWSWTNLLGRLSSFHEAFALL